MKKLILLFLLIPTLCFAQDDIDIFGGWTGLQSATTYSVTGNNAESVTGTTLVDTGAFAGLNLVNRILQPDVNDYTYFIIKAHDNDTLYIEPCDRLDDVVISNGTMETTESWDDLGTPTLTTFSTTAILGDYALRVVGDSAGDGVTQTGLTIQGERTGHNSGWDGKYTAIGYVHAVSGDVAMNVTDNAGELYNGTINTGNGSWEDFEITTIDSSYEGAGTGAITFSCTGGACEFYIDDIVVGEYSYGYYNDYKGLDDFNTGTQEYATYGSWRTELIGKRWWVIDPLDNVWFSKGLNNFDSCLITGRDFDGNTFITNMTDKYGASSCGSARYRIEDVKSYGFNHAGSIITSYIQTGGETGTTDLDVSIYGTFPYISQMRVKDLNFSEVGELNMRGSLYDGAWVDTYDPGWYERFNDGIISWGFGSDNSQYRQQSGGGNYDLTTYENKWLHFSANPWYIGLDLDEEPRGSGSGYGHIGYYIFTSQEDGTTADDGINDTLRAFVNWLRAKYTDGTEAEFVANITYDGSDEISSISGWSNTVSGYVDAQHDTDALSNLNTAWGTTYTTWTEVIEENGDDDFGFATQSDCTVDSEYCKLYTSSPDAELQADLDLLQGNYMRKYIYPFYEEVFGPDGLYRGNKLNLGSGLSYYMGWAYGLQSVDGSTKYVDVMYAHGLGAAGGSTFASAADSPYPSTTSVKSYKDMYAINGIPIMHESVWMTGEADSQFNTSNGTIDAVYKQTDVDYAVYRGRYDNYSGTKIAEDTAITWNSGADTGTLWWQFEKAEDQPIVHGDFVNRFIIIADAGSIGNLTDNDVITDGVNSFTVSNTPTRSSMIVDEDANFDTDFNNPVALDNRYYWTVLVDDDDPAPRMYYMTEYAHATERSLICYKNFQNGPGYGGADYTDVNVGDRYHMNFIFQDGNDYHDIHYELDTQEKRANMYINVLSQSWENIKTDDGIYFDIGYSHFSPWDYGFSSAYAGEVRQFGLYTIKDNAYDGVEATTLGADGIAGTDDDEEGDYGDFVGPVSNYLTNIYRTLQPRTKLNTTGAFSGSIR